MNEVNEASPAQAQPSDLQRLVMLPCPFCGSIPVVESGFSPMESIHYAWCSNEDCELSPVGRDERLFSIDWWNTRAT